MVVVVLGHRLESATIHAELRGRIAGGIRAFEGSDAPCLLCTGGQSNPDVERTECGVMGEYAVRRGVSPDRIVLDPYAFDTIGNAFFARELLDALGLGVERLRVVTSDYHVPRAKYAFEQCFGPHVTVEPVNAVETDRDAHAESHREKLQQTREFFAPIPAGDIDAVRHRLHAHHDLYDFSESVDPITA